MFLICSDAAMGGDPIPQPPILDRELAASIASWVLHAPRQVLAELVDSDARAEAASVLGEIIVANMTMIYPEFVEAIERSYPFK